MSPGKDGRPVKVLHIIQNLNYGGMERLLGDIVRGVSRQRFESHVLVLEYVGRFGEELQGVAHIHQAPPMSRLSLLWPRALARQIRQIGPDVVHTHSGVWYKATRAARGAGVPRVVHTEHGRQMPDPWIARFVDGLASRYTDVAVAVSDPVARALESGIVAPPCRVEKIINGVDTDRFDRGPSGSGVRTEQSIARSTPVIGSIGRLEPVKGYDVMIEAFADLLARPGWQELPVLLLAGDGSQREGLERRCRELGMESQVRFLGWRDDVDALLRAFDVFTLASRSEGTSVSLLEAMSAGVCPVVTDVGGNRAVLGPDLAHRIVPPEDPAALSQAWTAALTDGSARNTDGEKGRKRARTAYSAAAMVASYERLYETAGNSIE